MVARNFSLQDLPFSRLLSVPDDDDREFLNLEELKPHHLTEFNGDQVPSSTDQSHLNEDFNQRLQLNQGLSDEDYNVYYDLSSQNK